MQKWTDEQRRKFKATMRQKKAAKAGITMKLIEELPVRISTTPKYNGSNGGYEVLPDNAEEFARFMAAAWRIFKSGN